MKKLLSAFLIIIGCSSCHKMEFVSTGGKPVRLHHTNNRAERSVKVFFSEKEVPVNAERIGVISSHVNKQGKSLIKAKEMAAHAHCNAILLVNGQEQSGAGKMGNMMLGGNYFTGKWLYYCYQIPETDNN